MKRLIALFTAAAMLFSVSGCMVNMNEKLTVPVQNEEGEDVDFYTYFGEAIAPVTMEYAPDNIPVGKYVNVVKFNPEGVKLWYDSLSESEISDMKLLARDIDYEVKIAKDAIDKALSDPETELTDDERETAEAEAALFDMSLLQSGISIAAFNSIGAQERVNVKYPGLNIVDMFTLSIADRNGVYPVTGTAVDLQASYSIPEGEKADEVLVITPNRVLSCRHAKTADGALEFTVPSTIGTLILVAKRAE